jgi:sugar phosphate isomerase/epimerase
MGTGDLALIAQLKALEADGYKGLFTIETHFVPPGGNQMLGSWMSLDSLRLMWKAAQ